MDAGREGQASEGKGGCEGQREEKGKWQAGWMGGSRQGGGTLSN